MEMLKNVWEKVCDFAKEYVSTPLSTIGVRDVIDILLLAELLYILYSFCRNRRAGRVLSGLAVIVVVAVLSYCFRLTALSYIARFLATSAFFCIVVLFQPELRDALERIGNCTLLNPRSNTLPRKKMDFAKEVVEETVDAVFTMSESRTGALIVFEGLTKLGDFTSTGKLVDAKVTSYLLQNIFFENSPLHDGALVIRDMRIYAASCVLPSSKNSSIDFGTLGTRHRGAVGVTEYSDALVVIVSEQTGTVSVAQDGKLLRGLDKDTLTDLLMTYIAGNAYLRPRKKERKDLFKDAEETGSVSVEPLPDTEAGTVSPAHAKEPVHDADDPSGQDL